jgi:Protein of unknown function (DUF3108)
MLVLALMPGAAAGQGRADTGMRLSYDVYVRGLYSMAVTLDLRFDGERYFLRSRLESGGVVAWFSDFRLEAAAEGWKRGLEMMPTRYRNTYRKHEKRRRVAIDFDRGRVDRVAAIPPPADDDRAAVPPERYAGAVDPLTGIIWLLGRLNFDGATSETRLIYDGRRLYEMSAEACRPAGADAPDNRICQVTLNWLAGFSAKEYRKQSYPRRLEVEFAPARFGRLPVPLFITTEMNGRSVRARLAGSAGLTAQPLKQPLEARAFEDQFD